MREIQTDERREAIHAYFAGRDHLPCRERHALLVRHAITFRRHTLVIGTRWEAYIVVLLVCGMVMSLGFVALSVVDLMS